MIVPHCSTSGFYLAPFTVAALALLLVLALGLTGEAVAYGEDVPEPTQAAKTDEGETPEAAPAEEPPASSGAVETVADEEPLESPPQAASPQENEQPTAAPEASPAAEEKPPGAGESDPEVVADNTPEVPMQEDASETAEEDRPGMATEDDAAEAAADDSSDESTQEDSPATAEEETPGMSAEVGTAEAEAPAALPPKPAGEDVLDSVLPTSDTDVVERDPETAVEAETAEAPASQDEMVVGPSELDLPPDLESAMDEFMDEGDKPQALRFVFRYQPWEDVLEWFADQSDLSLIMDTAPTGTFNYTDTRNYTPAEAIDLLNSVLLIKGYTLVRRDRMLMVINLEDGIPPNLVTTVPIEELDERGEFELIGILFQLNKFEPEEAATEIEKLIGPQGAVVVLPKTRQLHVIETAGRLRTIRDVIQRVEDPQGLVSGKLESYEFGNILPDEGLMVLRQLLDIPLDANATEDESFRFALDPMGMRLLFSGTADMVAKAKEILEAVDVATGDGENTAVLESLQLEVYPIAVADPESVLKVMQTLMEGLPGVRLSTDPKTGSLVALARPSDHATIQATIDQMQFDVRRIEVIFLQRVDPQLAAISIKKMFGDADDEENTTAPTVEADPAGRQLIVHGTENQIAQIRVLLGKMGETEFADGPVSTGSRIRVLQIGGQSAETALQNLRMIWPTISDNPIKEVTPFEIIPSLRQEAIPQRVPGRGEEPLQQRGPDPGRELPPAGIPGLYRPSQQSQPPAPPAAEPIEDRQTSRPMTGRFHFAAQTEESAPAESAEESPSDQPQVEPKESVLPTPGEEAPETPKPKSPIIISRGPNGLMIASDDVEALDEFERLFNSMTGGVDSDRTELTIFYLKHAKAAVVAATLTQIIGSGTTGSATATEDSILGQLVGGALGSTMGSLLSLGASTLSPTGMLRITAEPRLNALIVEANATDLRTIEEVLKLLDMPESPEEILVNPRARLIPVYNMAAEEVETIVKQVYAEAIQGGSSRGGSSSRQSSPMEMIMAMRGGGRGDSGQRGGNSAAAQEEPEKLTVGVDARSNSLVVFSSQSLYEEIQLLVDELDTIAGVADDEDTQVITLGNLNPEAMKSALQAIMGENLVTSSSSSSSSRGSTPSRSGSSGQPSRGMSDDMRRRIEFMRAMSGRGGSLGGGAPGGFGGRPSFGGGGPGGGRPGGGGGPGGGRPGGGR